MCRLVALRANQEKPQANTMIHMIGVRRISVRVHTRRRPGLLAVGLLHGEHGRVADLEWLDSIRRAPYPPGRRRTTIAAE